MKNGVLRKDGVSRNPHQDLVPREYRSSVGEWERDTVLQAEGHARKLSRFVDGDFSNGTTAVQKARFRGRP